MIKHRPAGSGHPYAPDTEQRWPVHPIAGEPVRVGVRASADVVRIDVELIAAGSEPVVAALKAVPRTERGQEIDGGHLASAQAALAAQPGGWQVELDAPEGPFRYRFTGFTADDVAENTEWFEARGGVWHAAGTAALAVTGDASRILPGSVEVFDDGERVRRARFALALADGEHVTGFGERFDTLDHRGLALDSVVFEQYKSQGKHRKTYLPMPFAHVVGGDGWGFHVQTSRRVWFDVGATTRDRLVVEAEVDAPTGADGVVSLALYAGAPTEVLDQFLTATGRPVELPDWVFRLWASGNEWNTQAEIERQMALHAEHRIPVGNLVIEAWSDESTFTIFRDATYTVRDDGGPMRLADFEFPADGAWPDPKGMVGALHDQDIKVHLWQIPLIKMDQEVVGQVKADADAAVRENVLVQEETADGTLVPYRNRGWWFPEGLMPDLTDERAAAWWTAKRRYLVDEVGIDGFKTDGGEHAWGAELRYLDGTRGDEGNNRYPVAYPAAYGRLLESCGKAPVTFSRAGFTGSPAHGAFWAGDENSTWEAFRWSMLAGLSAAACGIVYWGWDIAGFSGDLPEPELYVRAMAASAFVPIMQYHSEFNYHRKPARDRTPWHIAEQTGDDVIAEVRDIVELRERLVPYLADAARESVETSRPLMRPLYFDHPADAQVWDHPIQWMLGDALLVAPVLEPAAATWPVYLPAGEWVDAWTGSPVTGGQTVDVATPRHRVPVFVRADRWADLQPVFA